MQCKYDSVNIIVMTYYGGKYMIILMRHGADDDSRLGGWSNAKLSKLGIEQVKNASEKISKFNIRQIFSSDLPRAAETAEIIAARLHLNITFLKEFREANNGDLAGMLKEEAKKEYPGLYWNTLSWEQAYPNGESPKQFYERVKNAWITLKKLSENLNGNVLLVTHGGVIDIILCCENNRIYTNKYQTFRLENAEIICI